MPAKEEDLPPTPSPPRVRTKQRGPTRFEKEVAATGRNVEVVGDPKIIGPWRIGKTIGKGASGRVKIAKHNRTGQYAAIKIIPKHVLLMTSRMSIADAAGKHDKAVLGLEREIVIMKLIDHPNIMSLYDVWETSKELYLILEYVEGGELFDYLVSQGRLGPDEASRYFQQIIAGVDYCHRFNICHRDLKPENLLLDSDKNIKIADFGMAALEPSGRLLETSCGSPHYASPEIVAGVSYHGAASDIWSCGVILFALLTGRLPFDDENIRVLLQKVKSGRYILPPELPGDAKDLLSRMLIVDPEQRISMADVMKHPFFMRRHDTDSAKQLRIPEPPRLDLITCPVKNEDAIDRDILRNLRTLWSGSSESQIIKALLTKDKTWEKAFYVLLLQYRNKNLENYDPHADREFAGQQGAVRQYQPLPMGDAESHATRFRGDVQRRHTSGSSEKRRKEGSSSHRRASRRPSVSGPSRRVSHKPSTTTTTNTSSPQATRPAPARPTHPPTSANNTIRGPSTPSRRPVGGPRPPGSPGHSREPTIRAVNTPSLVAKPIPANTPADPRLPKITLQAPTPSTDEKGTPPPTGLGLSIPAPPPTPSPAPSNPTSPILGALGMGINGNNISVPQVQDAALQKFFHDIAEQLQLIGNASPRSSLAMDSPTQSPQLPSTPVVEAQESSTPVVPAKADRNSRIERPVPQRAMTDQPTAVARPVPEKRRSYLGDASARENTMVAGPSKPSSKTASKYSNTSRYSTQTSTTEKNRKSLPAIAPSELKRKSKPAPLDLTPKTLQSDQLLSPTGSPYLGTPHFGSGPPSPLIVGPSNEVKQSWFSNLFSWKPAMFTLISADDCASSRAECVKLLESFGASVIIEDADGWGVLKCRLDEIRDVSGIIISKSVRFRIEFLPHATWSSGSASQPNGMGGGSSGYNSAVNSPRLDKSPTIGGPPGGGVAAGGNRSITTSMTMVQEKGALSAFRAVYARIRSEWRLDSLKSPALSSNSKFASSPMASPALSTDNAQILWS